MALILLAGAALFALVMALVPHPPELPVSDKTQHMLAFAVLAALALPAFPRVHPVVIATWLAGFGALIEILQEIPSLHRDSSFLDWIADMTAVIVVLALGSPLRRHFRDS